MKHSDPAVIYPIHRAHPMLKRLFLAATLVLLAGCDQPLGGDDGNVSIESEAGALVIRNTGDTPLYTFGIATSATTIVDWGPCTDPDHCDGIAPGAEGRVPYTNLVGYQDRSENSATVHTWRLRRTAGGEYQVADMRARRVVLKFGSP